MCIKSFFPVSSPHVGPDRIQGGSFHETVSIPARESQWPECTCNLGSPASPPGGPMTEYEGWNTPRTRKCRWEQGASPSRQPARATGCREIGIPGHRKESGWRRVWTPASSQECLPPAGHIPRTPAKEPRRRADQLPVQGIP